MQDVSAFGPFPSGPAVVSAETGSGETPSQTVDSFATVSVDPPLVVAGIDPGDGLLDAIKDADRFEIAVPSPKGARLECDLESTTEAGNRVLVVGRVRSVQPGEDSAGRPLTFSRTDSFQIVGHLPSVLGPVDSTSIEVTGEPPAEPLATIAVIGGGAAGTLTAVQLLRRSAPGLRVVLIEKDETVGPGLAYGTENDEHRLNVPAGQMIALPDKPWDFLEWVRRENPETEPQEYLARSRFGRYLIDLLETTERENDRVPLERVRGEAVAIDPGAPGEPVTIRLADGTGIDADRVVLALGNAKPPPVPNLDPSLLDSPKYVSDPWAEGALDGALTEEAVLMVGTGLTMVDMAISLGAPGGPDLHAVSRHGLLPRAHGDAMPIRGRPVALPEDRCSLTELTSRLLTEIAVAGVRGEDWRIAFDSLRPITNDLWRSLDLRDQKRFMTDLSRIWGVHRHRMAPRVALRLERLKVNRRLRVQAATIDRIAPEGDRIAVDLRLNSFDAEERLIVDRVINCTGPTWDPRKLEQPLVKDLLGKGLVRADALGIGFDVDMDGALVDNDANPSDWLFTIGPLRNGVLLETTAIPEIGQQAELLSDLLLSSLSGVLGSTRRLSAA